MKLFLLINLLCSPLLWGSPAEVESRYRNALKCLQGVHFDYKPAYSYRIDKDYVQFYPQFKSFYHYRFPFSGTFFLFQIRRKSFLVLDVYPDCKIKRSWYQTSVGSDKLFAALRRHNRRRLTSQEIKQVEKEMFLYHFLIRNNNLEGVRAVLKNGVLCNLNKIYNGITILDLAGYYRSLNGDRIYDLLKIYGAKHASELEIESDPLANYCVSVNSVKMIFVR